jgi:hypothetical protein
MKEECCVSNHKKSFFGKELIVVNIGIKLFYEDLKKQNVKVAHVDWRPPAGGDFDMITLLEKLK